MAKLTRKQLKKDRFVEEVGEAVGFFATHRNLILGSAVGVIALAIAGTGYYQYAQQQNEQARIDLQEAMGNYYGEVSLDNIPDRVTFATTIEKEMRTEESLNKVAENYGGRIEGDLARLHLALFELRDGDPEEGKKKLEELIGATGVTASSLARKALADQLQREGKNEEAVKHYEYLVEHPTDVMPRERVELYGLYDALLAMDEQKAYELVKAVEERDGAGKETASTHALDPRKPLGHKYPALCPAAPSPSVVARTSGMLGRLRFPSERSRGRRFPETPHPYRSDYQRDRDRIIHSRAFRRLEHKTQVFTIPDSDHLRNRLTHTIEVSQIARTVAKALALNEEVVEALALCHDVGHPPFGHAGEDVLDAQMRKYGGRFEHNLHALRIVEYFEHRYAGFQGLNLTFEVREGIVKHSHDYAPGVFPQLDEYMLDQRPLLEAQLVDPADEITYNCADLDDAVDAGLLEPTVVREEVGLFDECLSNAEKKFPEAAPQLVFNEALRAFLSLLVSALIEGTASAAEQAGVRSPDDVRDYRERLARLGPEAAEASRQLHAVLAREVYNSPSLSAARLETGSKLAGLFEFFMQRPEELPPSYRKQSETEPPHRVVCDYLAGMTDTFLLRRYGELLA